VLEDAIEKADLLIEAMGWIRQFRDKITVIKLGGSVPGKVFNPPEVKLAGIATAYGPSGFEFMRRTQVALAATEPAARL